MPPFWMASPKARTRPLAVAILVNDIPPGQKGPARAMTDDMLDVIAAYLEAEATT